MKARVLTEQGTWGTTDIEPVEEMTQEQRQAVIAGIKYANQWKQEARNALKLERLMACADDTWEEEKRLGAGGLTMLQVLRVVEGRRKLGWKQVDKFFGLEGCDRSQHWALGFFIGTGVVQCYTPIQGDDYQNH